MVDRDLTVMTADGRARARRLLGLLGLVAVAAGGAVTAPARAGARPLPLAVVATVPLTGPTDRFDYTSIDPVRHRLWISHMNADELIAVDLRTRRVILTIPAPGVHGVIAVPSLNRVYASATDDHEALTIDATTGKVLARTPAGDYPDGLAYAASSHRVYVSDESGGAETVLAEDGRRLATIDLGGAAGNVQYDSRTRQILVAVQSRNQIAVIDPGSNAIVRRIPLDGCDSAHSLLVDAARRLAFVGCQGNARLLSLDLRTMKVTGSFQVGPDPDVLALDHHLGRLYVAAESGVVAVLAETGRTATLLGRRLLEKSAHSVAVDQATHLVYFPLEARRAGRPELLIMKPTR